MVGRTFLGRYQVTRLLGEGGMGRVYLARQLDLGRQVVVKVMHDHVAADPLFRERFQRETLLMARFQHPYAVTLYDASLNDPQGPCIVMEYIRGVTLDTVLQRNATLTAARVGRLLGQLCEVLQAAHNEGIVHRDLKPTNLMIVDADTPYELLKVMDFGLAKPLEKGSHPKLNGSVATGAEFAVGTPGYMCPEQARGEDMDHRGDLYSVGVILYELLTGRLPFAGRCTMDVLLAHATEDPPPFSEASGGAFAEMPNVESVVRACLAKGPADRPVSARELSELYDAALALDQVGLRADETPSGRHLDRTPTAPARPGQPPEPPPPAPESSSETPMPSVLNGAAYDPNSVVHHLEAWMPEKIAAYKLRGFVQDAEGELVESVPGRIRVRVGGRGTPYGRGSSWFGLSRRADLIEMDLYLQRPDPSRDSQLRITVVLRPLGGTGDPEWRARCTQIFCDLRGYLMGQNG